VKKLVIALLIAFIAVSFSGCGEAAKLNSFIESSPDLSTGMNSITLTPSSFVEVKSSDDIGITTREGTLCYATKNAINNVEIGKTYDFKCIRPRNSEIILIMGVNREISE